MPRRTYSELLKQEGIRLATEIGPAKAARIIGMNARSLIQYCTRDRKRRGIRLSFTPWYDTPAKYTRKQKEECVKMAQRLLDSGYAKSVESAFIAAGKSLGMNGRSIKIQLDNGQLYAPFLAPIQHPDTGSASTGSSSQTASPQAIERALQKPIVPRKPHLPPEIKTKRRE